MPLGKYVRAHAPAQFCADVCTRAYGAFSPGTLRSAAALWRAGKYTWSAAGSNACPDGAARIDDLSACQAAATAAGKTSPSSSENDDLYPKGCYSDTTAPSVFFNAHVTGSTAQIGFDILVLCTVTGVPASPARPAPPTASPHMHTIVDTLCLVGSLTLAPSAHICMCMCMFIHECVWLCTRAQTLVGFATLLLVAANNTTATPTTATPTPTPTPTLGPPRLLSPLC